MNFDNQPSLTNGFITLRPLAAADFEGVFKAASDPVTWAGHPTRNRHQRDVFRSAFDFLLQAVEKG
ncbi:hypothetical protein [Aliiroseovarius subalbicans]|uniref:hypothetical protein n=1 Tax=Aliiroseovarius subalbicans TaxID=2925840 RepID=UPI001F579C23|nr:hypothetical protein [Aliiroseovarius subalbicans]MCI2400209.1 hypothetical protein [Aliiroseovarius subalbicans]